MGERLDIRPFGLFGLGKLGSIHGSFDSHIVSCAEIPCPAIHVQLGDGNSFREEQTMKNCRAVGWLLMVILVFVFAATAADEPKLTFKFTTVQLKGAQDTRVFGTNNLGVMVGAYVDSGGVSHGSPRRGGATASRTSNGPIAVRLSSSQ